MSSGDPKAALAVKFLDSFLREIVLDTAIHTHAKIKRARSICHLCGVRCQAHTPAAQSSTSLNPVQSTSGTPVTGSSGFATQKDYYSNNPLFECLVCSRQVSSNRYATHLAKCMGMGSKGGRKGAARNAKAVTGVVATGRSLPGTPRYSSDLDDDSFAKRKNGVTVKNGTKRANSPLATSTLANARMNKRIKTSSPTPPPAESVGVNRSYSSQTFAPSGLSTSTVLNGSPLNPNHANGTTSNTTAKKRKRLIDDDEEDDGGDSYHEASDGESNEEEGEISDDDDDVALAARVSSSPHPLSGSAKSKVPLRSTPSASANGSKPKTFIVADDSDDSDDNLATRRKIHAVSDDDDDEDEDDNDDDDDDDDDDNVQVTRVSHPSSHHNRAAGESKKKSTSNGTGLQRERGSDGEFIDVESASEQSDADSF